MKTQLETNVKKRNLSWTKFGEKTYSNLWYVDNKNKIVITFSPRGGCSISFQQYLDLVGLLEDGFKYNSFIHHYRGNVFIPNISYIEINKLISQNYTFIKFIMNPYIRAVSSFRGHRPNETFRQFLKNIVVGNTQYLDDNIKYHMMPQYIEGEKNIITKYIKIDENEKYTIKLHDGTDYEIDVNKYSSIHHGARTDFKEFCGDMLKSEVNKHLPKSYKYFYDDEIKKLVEIYYKDDIEKYGFTFPF